MGASSPPLSSGQRLMELAVQMIDGMQFLKFVSVSCVCQRWGRKRGRREEEEEEKGEGRGKRKRRDEVRDRLVYHFFFQQTEFFSRN